MLLRKYAIRRYFIFPPHPTSASKLPGETGKTETVFSLKGTLRRRLSHGYFSFIAKYTSN